MSPPNEEVLVERGPNGVAVVTLNRPKSLNALTRNMRAQLVEIFGDLDRDGSCAAVVLTGAGHRAFAAGQDLEESKEFSAASVDTWIDEWDVLYRAVLGCSKPTVAAINGYAVGAAFQVAVLCDLRIASQTARFGMPEINDAIPCITGTWSLYELVGRGRAMELVITGRMLDATEALQWGVVSQVVASSALRDAAIRVAAELGAKPSIAMQADKRLYASLLLERWPAAVRMAKEAHHAAFASGEPARRMSQFVAGKKTS